MEIEVEKKKIKNEIFKKETEKEEMSDMFNHELDAYEQHYCSDYPEEGCTWGAPVNIPVAKLHLIETDVRTEKAVMFTLDTNHIKDIPEDIKVWVPKSVLNKPHFTSVGSDKTYIVWKNVKKAIADFQEKYRENNP